MRVLMLFSLSLAVATAVQLGATDEDLKNQPISWPFNVQLDIAGILQDEPQESTTLKQNHQLPQKKVLEAKTPVQKIDRKSQTEKDKIPASKEKTEVSQPSTPKPKHTEVPKFDTKFSPDMDPKWSKILLTEIANSGIDNKTWNTNVTDLDEDTLITALNILDRSVLQMVPVGCRDAFALHVLVGFCRHSLVQALKQQWRSVVQDYTAMDLLRTSADSAQPVLDQTTADLWRAITDRVEKDLNEKFRTWAPSTKHIYLDNTYAPWLRIMTLSAVKEETFGQLLQNLAKAVEVFISPFTGTNTTCDVTGAIGDLEKHVNDLGFFLANDTVIYFSAVRLPTDVQTMLTVRLELVMELMAAQMAHYIRALVNDPTGTASVFLHACERMGMERLSLISNLRKMLEEPMTPDFINLVNRQMTAEESSKIMEMTIRSMTMSAADLDVSEEDIKIMLGITTDLVTAKMGLPDEKI